MKSSRYFWASFMLKLTDGQVSFNEISFETKQFPSQVSIKRMIASQRQEKTPLENITIIGLIEFKNTNDLQCFIADEVESEKTLG